MTDHHDAPAEPGRRLQAAGGVKEREAQALLLRRQRRQQRSHRSRPQIGERVIGEHQVGGLGAYASQQAPRRGDGIERARFLVQERKRRGAFKSLKGEAQFLARAGQRRAQLSRHHPAQLPQHADMRHEWLR